MFEWHSPRQRSKRTGMLRLASVREPEIDFVWVKLGQERCSRPGRSVRYRTKMLLKSIQIGAVPCGWNVGAYIKQQRIEQQLRLLAIHFAYAPCLAERGLAFGATWLVSDSALR